MGSQAWVGSGQRGAAAAAAAEQQQRRQQQRRCAPCESAREKETSVRLPERGMRCTPRAESYAVLACVIGVRELAHVRSGSYVADDAAGGARHACGYRR